MHQRQGLTSVIHGKYNHEETIATASFCEEYICVKNMKEAEMVADYIVNGGDREEFLKYFENAVSKGFDPDVHLQKIGLANQTTMYKKETKAIGQMLQKAMMKKFGPAEVNQHYAEFDTICDATQVRVVHSPKHLYNVTCDCYLPYHTFCLSPFVLVTAGTSRRGLGTGRQRQGVWARFHPSDWRI